MFTNMRSNDAFIGLPHDIFAFTMIQEIVARALKLEPGTYSHAVGSLHLYKTNRDAARKYLKEGWQSTVVMPRCPKVNRGRRSKNCLKPSAPSATAVGSCVGTVAINRPILVGFHPASANLLALQARESDKIAQIKKKISVRVL